MYRRRGRNNYYQQRIQLDPATALLRSIVYSRRNHYHPVAGLVPTLFSLDRLSLGLDCDEVYQNLFIGNKHAAMDKNYLHQLGVTHILNVAEDGNPQRSILDSLFYQDSGFSYMGIAMYDDVNYQISSHFEVTASYVDNAIKNGGKVLVNCLRGVSRSGTIATSYLMLKRNLTAPLALRIICQKRKICPNNGFLQQLANLNDTLYPIKT